MVPFLLAQILMQASFYSQIGAKNVALDFDDWWKEFTNHQVFTAHVDLTNNQLSDLICNPENDDIVQKNVKTNNTHLPNPIFMNLTNEEMANSTMIALLDSYTVDDTQLIIITFGILGNILTILYIPFKRKLRKPFYYCIINLAVGDTLALFCSPYFLQLARNELSVLKCQYFTFYFVFEIVKQSSNLLSALGVLLLGYVRYLLFVHPFRSRTYLTKRRVFLSFFFLFSYKCRLRMYNSLFYLYKQRNTICDHWCYSRRISTYSCDKHFTDLILSQIQDCTNIFSSKKYETAHDCSHNRYFGITCPKPLEFFNYQFA